MLVQKNYYHDIRVRRYVESLTRMGASVDVICPAPYQLDEAFEIHDQIRVYSTPIHHVDKSRVRYIFEYFFSFILYFIQISILHIKNRYEVIHVHNIPDFLVFAAIIPKLMGTPLVLDIHDPMPEVFISKYGERSNSFVVGLVKLQEKFSCWFADEVITVNTICEANLIKRGIPPKKITVVHNYPNAAIFDRNLYSNELQSSKDNFTLIYPGTLAPRYGLETVVRALPQLKQKIPEIRLLIFCQNTPYKDELLELADQLGVSSLIEIRPLIRNEEVPQQLIKANIGIYPAINDVHMSLATPTKVLEFSAMGIPIISSRLKMVESIFGDSAVMFFESENETQFAQCVLELYQNPTLQKELTTNAYQIFLQKFSWDHEFLVYQEMLYHLVQRTVEVHNLNAEKGSG